MEFILTIDQYRAEKWGLSFKEAAVLDYLSKAAKWAETYTDQETGTVFYHMRRSKLAQELPKVSKSKETFKKHLSSLESKGIIERAILGDKPYYRLTAKGSEWCSMVTVANKIAPNQPGSNLNHPRVKSEPPPGSNLNHDQSTNDQSTNDQTPYNPPKGESGQTEQAGKSYPEEFEQAWSAYPKRDGGNPKRRAYNAWKARIKAGHEASTMVAGAERYAAHVQAHGTNGTRFVMQAATFFGPDERFLEEWPSQAAEKANEKTTTPSDFVMRDFC